mgnify:CR=1 FL=1
MMNIKMSDVFGSLAITSKSAGEYKLESTNGELYAAFTARKFCTYAAEAIDKYDINESRVAELIKCGNEFEFVINEQRKRIDQLELFAKQSQGVIEHINVIASSDQKRIAELEAEVKSLRGCNESPSVSPTITAGCYCTDIETEVQYIATCEALVKLGCLASGFYSYPDSGMCSYRDEYLINGNVGWVEPSMEISNGIYHAKGDLRHCFTTLVSHRDIIKAAEG